MADKTARVLPDLAAQNAALLAEIAALKANAKAAFRVELSDKGTGTVLLRGVRRFPLAFYPGEWMTIGDNIKMVLDFIAEHKLPLTKPTKQAKA